jgi:acyl carrier protein
MEVEEAVTGHPDVSSCAAFSALHDVLQEVVGIVIVMEKGQPRLDLASLHEFLGDRLATPKWPQCIVFMDGLPKSHTNKLLRVKLGSRLQLPELSDEMSTAERTFEALCPRQGISLQVPIPSQRVAISAEDIQQTLTSLLVNREGQRLIVAVNPSRAGAFICYLVQIDQLAAIDAALKNLDRYSVPSHFVETHHSALSSSTLPPPRMMDALASVLQGGSLGKPDPVLNDVQELITKILNLDFLPGIDANFFQLGGTSMLASQLASQIRKQFSISCSGSEIFQQSSPGDLAKLIRQRSDEYTTSTVSVSSGSQGSWNKDVSDQGAAFESERMPPQNTFLPSVFQLLPMFVVSK